VPPAPADSAGRVAVVGGGAIGVGWAIVFASAGRDVVVFEPDAARRAGFPADCAARLERLARGGLLSERADAIAARVTLGGSLADAVADATHVQECAPERADLKRRLFEQIEAVAPETAVIASSSSAITVSTVAKDLRTRSRCLVAHPGNPPYLLPVVELVPAPFTDPDIVTRAEDFFGSVGMEPVRLAREVEGFVFNRLQGALLREAYCLVRDGVVTAEGVDRAVRDGLGRRWAVVGPFETSALNVRGGIEAHAARMGEAYARMGADRGQHDPWTTELVERVAADVERRLPAAGWEKHVARRDEAMIALERARRDSDAFPVGDPT
jgi:3-hydroxyacyl-CoA dehydrogenase